VLDVVRGHGANVMSIVDCSLLNLRLGNHDRNDCSGWVVHVQIKPSVQVSRSK
jgi:hypothetical protein